MSPLISTGKLLVAMVPIAASLALIVEILKFRPFAPRLGVVAIVVLLELSGYAIARFRGATFEETALQLAAIPCVFLALLDADTLLPGKKAPFIAFLLLVVYYVIWNFSRRRTWFARLPAWLILVLNAIGFGLFTLVLLLIPVAFGVCLGDPFRSAHG